LLAAFPTQFRQRLLASCDEVDLTFAQVLCEPGDKIRYVYFPVACFISLITELDDDKKLEVGIVGDEGMLGTSLLLGVDIWPQHAIVQGAGMALRMSAAALLNHCKRSSVLQRRLGKYIHVMLSQLAQTAACTHFHAVDARLARWLLLTRDRAYSDEFRLTHEFLAYMLGVRRVGITEAATALHKQGLIDYRRGTITILDVAALERISCRCYGGSKHIYEQVMRTPRRSM
jgi:CRP-like cAMP-binding protein